MPSDRSLIDLFGQHRAEFDEVRSMSQADKRIQRISTSFVTLVGNIAPTPDELDSTLSRQRLAKYRRLLSDIHDPNGIIIEDGTVTFMFYGEGFGGTGRVKAILWSAQPQSPLTQDLDSLSNVRTTPFIAFRRIAPEWYLEYETF